jgi:hypothetical protein
MYGALEAADIQAIVNGLHGVYAAQDLYEAYCEAVRACDGIPAHKIRVGQWLVKQGYPRRKVKGRVWYTI